MTLVIDVPEHGYLLKRGCSGSPPVSDIVELAAVGDRVIGRSKSSGPFVFDTRSSELLVFRDLLEALRKFSPPPELQSANSFYIRRRWRWLDLAALGIIGTPGAGIIFLCYRLFIRGPSLM